MHLNIKTNNRIRYLYTAGGVTKFIDANGITNTDFLFCAMTWSASADQFRAYFQGVQSGVTLTVLGAWAGALDAVRCCLGSDTVTPTFQWNGYLAHGFVLDYAATPAQIADLAIVR